uniref:ABC transporter permease n=1 Tax=Dietzia sp. SYD-A1 TaxID=2780141 RepID=UPI001891D8E8
RVTDAVAAVPHLLATVVVVALFRGSITALVLALAVTHWPPVARIVRAETQKVMASGYVAASRVAGFSPARLVRHHVLPAVAGQAALAVVVMLPHAVWHESTLSFLGIGVPPEEASLGTLIALSREDLLLGRWWALAFPSAALIVVTVAMALLAPAGRRGPRGWSPLPRHRHDDDEVLTLSDPRAVSETAPGPALRVDGLTVQMPSPDGRPRTVLADVTVAVRAGDVLAIVGESGAGKSTLADACCGLLPPGAQVHGRVVLRGTVGHVPQSAHAAFTPTRHVRGH